MYTQTISFTDEENKSVFDKQMINQHAEISKQGSDKQQYSITRILINQDKRRPNNP